MTFLVRIITPELLAEENIWAQFIPKKMRWLLGKFYQVKSSKYDRTQTSIRQRLYMHLTTALQPDSIFRGNPHLVKVIYERLLFSIDLTPDTLCYYLFFDMEKKQYVTVLRKIGTQYCIYFIAKSSKQIPNNCWSTVYPFIIKLVSTYSPIQNQPPSSIHTHKSSCIPDSAQKKISLMLNKNLALKNIINYACSALYEIPPSDECKPVIYSSALSSISSRPIYLTDAQVAGLIDCIMYYYQFKLAPFVESLNSDSNSSIVRLSFTRNSDQKHLFTLEIQLNNTKIGDCRIIYEQTNFDQRPLPSHHSPTTYQKILCCFNINSVNPQGSERRANPISSSSSRGCEVDSPSPSLSQRPHNSIPPSSPTASSVSNSQALSNTAIASHANLYDRLSQPSVSMSVSETTTEPESESELSSRVLPT